MGEDMYESSGGRSIRSVEEWVRARQHLPHGRSARMLAEAWLGHEPPQPAVLALERVFGAVVFDRGVVGHHTATPGCAGHCGDLVLFGHDDRGPLLLTVDGRLDEGFADPESQWLVRGTSDRREHRLRACQALGVASDLVPPGAWQLVHRLVATAEEAHRRGIERAVVAIHSFIGAPSPRGSGFAEVRALGSALRPASPPLEPGRPWRSGAVRDVEVWLLWIADADATLRRAVRRASLGAQGAE